MNRLVLLMMLMFSPGCADHADASPRGSGGDARWRLEPVVRVGSVDGEAGAEEDPAQVSSVTNWTPFNEDALEAFATELFSITGVRDSIEAVSHLLTIAAELRPGDETQVQFLGDYEGNLAFLYVDLRVNLHREARVRASGPVFDSAAQLFRQYWLGTLFPIDGMVRFWVEEADPVPGSDPEFAFLIETMREYGCYGMGIAGELEREEGAVHLELLGIPPLNSLCSPAFGPARFRSTLSLDSGRYEVWVTHRDRRTDGYELVITGSVVQLAPLGPLEPAFTEAELLPRFRRPAKNLAFYCGTTRTSTHLCTDIREWLLAFDGVEAFSFPGEGVVPYRLGISTHQAERHYFRFADDEVLGQIAECFLTIHEQLRETVGNRLTIEPWHGPILRVGSERSFHEPHIQAPENITSVCGNE